MKNIVTTYTFDASAKTVSCPEFSRYGLARILMIVNVTAGVIIYNPSNPVTNGSLSGEVLTLDYDTTSHNDTDILQIFVDDGDTGSTEQSLNQLVMSLTEFCERLDVYSDGAGRLQVALTVPSAQGALSSVGTVTSVTSMSTLSNLTNIGVTQIPLDNQLRIWMEGVHQQQVLDLFKVT